MGEVLQRCRFAASAGGVCCDQCLSTTSVRSTHPSLNHTDACENRHRSQCRSYKMSPQGWMKCVRPHRARCDGYCCGRCLQSSKKNTEKYLIHSEPCDLEAQR